MLTSENPFKRSLLGFNENDFQSTSACVTLYIGKLTEAISQLRFAVISNKEVI